MTLFHCPKCDKRVAISPHGGDYVHACDSGVEAVDNEDVLRIGDHTDYTGSNPIGTNKWNYQGIQNNIFGTRGDLEGEDVEKLTRRGKSITRWRTRQHLEYINQDQLTEFENK